MIAASSAAQGIDAFGARLEADFPPYGMPGFASEGISTLKIRICAAGGMSILYEKTALPYFLDDKTRLSAGKCKRIQRSR
ncbi:hypothetical protein [Pseudodesulfovibrio karagichevae]|uniref:Uncharacterized protein n=1 Tax=Pseudodesulfovibrio karagichevae TaxID=3239305 RepID=A0ABV4K4Z3_9BACT